MKRALIPIIAILFSFACQPAPVETNSWSASIESLSCAQLAAAVAEFEAMKAAKLAEIAALITQRQDMKNDIWSLDLDITICQNNIRIANDVIEAENNKFPNANQSIIDAQLAIIEAKEAEKLEFQSQRPALVEALDAVLVQIEAKESTLSGIEAYLALYRARHAAACGG